MLKNLNKLLIIILLSGFTTSCNKKQLKPIIVKRNFSGAVWVVRHTISTREKIDNLLDSVKDTDIKNIFVQVRGRGDAYYSSSIEPRAFDVPENFDPLAYIIHATRKTDIKIHAWVNISFILNAKNYPPSENHILSKHPDWVTYDVKGRPISDYSEKELRQNLLEGYFLDPALPEVKEYLNSIIIDILQKYKVDGLHYDFIRYPYSGYSPYYKKDLSDFGYNPRVMKAFIEKFGFDPRQQISEEQKSIFDQFREEQITEIVKRNTVSAKDINPELIVSAAVMPRYDWGKRVYFQNWPEWLKNNYIDIACMMSYTQRSKTFKNYIDYALKTGMKDRIFMGIRVKKSTSLKKAHDQIFTTYSNGLRGYVIFSFNHDEDYLENISDFIDYRRYVFQINL